MSITNEPEGPPGPSGTPTLTTEDFYTMQQAPAAAGRQIVCFQLSEQWYGIDIAYVHEVLRIGQIVALPDAAPAIIGICHLRGAILSVTDPKKIFRLEERHISEQSRIIVVEADQVETGLLVDAVSRVIEVTDDQIEPPLSTIDPATVGCLMGSCQIDGEVVTIIRPEAIIARSRGIQNNFDVARK